MRTLVAFLFASLIFVSCQTNTTEVEVSNADSVATQVDSTVVDTTLVVTDTTVVDSAQ